MPEQPHLARQPGPVRGSRGPDRLTAEMALKEAATEELVPGASGCAWSRVRAGVTFRWTYAHCQSSGSGFVHIRLLTCSRVSLLTRDMTRKADDDEHSPQFELRCGGLHLTVQRFPSWLVTLVTTATGAGAAWWTSR